MTTGAELTESEGDVPGTLKTIQWCDDCKTKPSPWCGNPPLNHTIRPLTIPVNATYEEARAIAYQLKTCPTCDGRGVVPNA